MGYRKWNDFGPLAVVLTDAKVKEGMKEGKRMEEKGKCWKSTTHKSSKHLLLPA